jgi:hypothetical protein
MRPRPGFNSLAWLLWHMTRGEDVGINLVIVERQQVLDEGDWPARLNILRRDGGTGMTAAEVDEFNEQISVDALLAYRVAVGHRTREIVRDLPPDILDRVIDAALVQRARDQRAFGPNAEWAPQRWEGKTKAFTLSWTVLGHSLAHWGECYVIRGLLRLPSI